MIRPPTNTSQLQSYAAQVQTGNIIYKQETMQEKDIRHINRARFVGLVNACLIFVFTLMAAASIMAMYSNKFRHFIHAKVTMIVLFVTMAIFSLLLLCCEQVIKSFQSVFYLIYSIGLALLVGALVTHLKSMIIVFSIFLILVLVIGLSIFAFTTSNSFGDFTSYLSVVGFVAIGLGTFSLFWKQDIVSLAFGAIIAILFGFYLVYQTGIIAGNYGTQYTDSDYPIASLSIFVSLVQLLVGFFGFSLC